MQPLGLTLCVCVSRGAVKGLGGPSSRSDQEFQSLPATQFIEDCQGLLLEELCGDPIANKQVDRRFVAFIKLLEDAIEHPTAIKGRLEMLKQVPEFEREVRCQQVLNMGTQELHRDVCCIL